MISQLLRKFEERAVEVDGINGKEQVTPWVDEDFADDRNVALISDSRWDHPRYTAQGLIPASRYGLAGVERHRRLAVSQNRNQLWKDLELVH